MASVRIREAMPADVGSIVSLMRTEMGWPDDERAEALWRWKHEDNPFGRSPVWVADADGAVVAVRAFLRWTMLGPDGAPVAAARAVDTATRSDFRGRGLFRTLTLHGIEALADEGVQFVFNTPNAQSRPGYLSMGWVSAGRLGVWVRPTSPRSVVGMVRARVPAGIWPVPNTLGVPIGRDSHFPGSVEHWRPRPGCLGTARSETYLRWRFGMAALGYRMVVNEEHSGFAIVRNRVRGAVVERELLEVMGAPDSWKHVTRERRGVNHLVALGRSPGRGWIRVPNSGPALVVRRVGSASLPPTLDLSLGDVELL